MGTFLYVALITAVISFMGWMVFWLSGESKDCLANPIEYFEEDADATCSCFNEAGQRFFADKINPLTINTTFYKD